MQQNQWIKVVSAAAAGALLLSAMPARATSLVTVYQDNFEGDTQGYEPGGWSFASGGATPPAADGLVAAPPNGGVTANDHNVLNDFSTSASGFYYVYKNMTAPSTTRPVVFSFDFNCLNTANFSSFVSLVNGSSAQGAALAINSTGETTGQAYLTGSSPLAITLGDWYHVTITLTPVDGSIHQADLTITNLSAVDDPRSESAAYTSPGVSGFNQILLAQFEGGHPEGFNLYVDNFLVQEVIPEPATITLLGIGATLLWLRRRGQR